MIFKDFSLSTPPLQMKLLDVVPQLDLKSLENTRWSKYSEGHLQNLSSCKERRALTCNLPLVDTNGFVEKLTLFLPRLALLHSPRTNYSIA
jgi:hypothetical protein